jgi:hypothetical protein
MRSIRYNHFFLIRTLWGSLRYADWDGAVQRFGPLGVLLEFLRALSGMSAWPFFIPAGAGWEPEQVRALLEQVRIPNWGWGYHQGEFVCQVSLRQAHWAQYLLQQQGVPLGGRLLAGEARNPYRRTQRRAGNRPHPGLDGGHPAVMAEQSPLQTQVSRRGPVARIDALVDRLADW